MSLPLKKKLCPPPPFQENSEMAPLLSTSISSKITRHPSCLSIPLFFTTIVLLKNNYTTNKCVKLKLVNNFRKLIILYRAVQVQHSMSSIDADAELKWRILRILFYRLLSPKITVRYALHSYIDGATEYTLYFRPSSPGNE